MDAEKQLDETLAKLTADPGLNAMFPFPVLGWRVTLMSGGEPDKYRVRIWDPDFTLLVDEVLDGEKVKLRLRESAATEERKALLMGRLLALQTEQYLRAL